MMHNNVEEWLLINMLSTLGCYWQRFPILLTILDLLVDMWGIYSAALSGGLGSAGGAWSSGWLVGGVGGQPLGNNDLL